MDFAPAHDERKLFQQLTGQYGGPAFVRRGRATEEAWEHLVAACRKARDEMLAMVRLRLGTLAALAGTLDKLAPEVCGDEEVQHLKKWHAELQPQLRLPVAPTTSTRQLRIALAELSESIVYFNQRWLTYLSQVKLDAVNALREGYNRFYILEKECALGSARIARRDFQRLLPATTADLLRELPTL